MTKQRVPANYSMRGVKVRCPVCGSSKFWERRVRLEQGISTMFRMEWRETDVRTLTCDRCGGLLWFDEDDS